MKKNKLLVTLADIDHINAAKQVFSSAHFYGGWKGDMMLILHDDAKEAHTKSKLRWFEENGIFVRYNRPIYNEKINDMSPIPLSKLAIFDSYFKRWEHIIFLDVDTVVRFDIDNIPKPKKIAAVPDWIGTEDIRGQFKPDDSFKENERKLFRELQNRYDLSRIAFNTGVISINTNILKRNTFDELLNLFTKYSNLLRFRDQPLINLKFYDQFEKLPYAYNAHGKKVFDWYSSDIDNGVILHFIGKNKPWLENNPLHKVWKTNLKKSDHIGEKPPYARKISRRKIFIKSTKELSRRKIHLFFIKKIKNKHSRLELLYNKLIRFL